MGDKDMYYFLMLKYRKQGIFSVAIYSTSGRMCIVGVHRNEMSFAAAASDACFNPSP
jgi:hypothetical protein